MRLDRFSSAPLDGLDLELGVVRVFGKGGKERLVPLGREARRWVSRYLSQARPGFARGRPGRLVFLSQRGGRLTPMGLWGLVRRHAVKAGIERVLTPHVLRHTFARNPSPSGEVSSSGSSCREP